ncbi:enoyl-CoA hydratase [Shewanella benthica KT99]|uniref:Enoyl-CoA hydratase n=1 Tax=Shewanella benthica KT99 TaxID=314608 RepID=A9D9J5_9GAMM|nr:enoyl-CoA hydratase [Shewanella benthica KT99]
MPVIAVFEGVCFGGGMQIALGADFRIAAADAKLSIMEAKWGLVPDMAGLVSLREVVSKD